MISKHKKLILSIGLILLIVSLGIFVFGAKTTQAGPGDWMKNQFIGGIVAGFGWILLGFLKLSGLVLNLFAGLVNGILNFTKFTKADIVIAGWTIVRDLTNMFFVLILLIIAFATILRIESYGMKQLLPKLIIAALLINFSLVLAGPIIDFSQVLTQFFIDEIKKGGTENFSTQIAGALNLSKIAPPGNRVCTTYTVVNQAEHDICNSECNDTSLDEADNVLCKNECDDRFTECSAWGESTTEIDWGRTLKDTLNIVMGLFMANIFSLVGIFVFGALAAFLIVRILAIWFLLIIAPAAWLLSILPNTAHLFKNWWKTFLKWCFFAPIYMFFVYLALASFKDLLTGDVIANLQTGVKPEEFMPNLFKAGNFLQFILVIGILIGGLIVAQKLSIHGAKGAIAMGKGLSNKVTGVAASKQWLKARKSVREEATKEKRKRAMQLRRTSGVRQWRRENIGFAKSKAEAKAKKNEAIVKESQRMGKTMDHNSVLKIAGKRRVTTMTRKARMERLAARNLLANPDSKEYGQMMDRSPTPKPGTSKYRKITDLANRVEPIVAEKAKRGEYIRYKLEKKKKEESAKGQKQTTREPTRPIEIVSPPGATGTGRKISEEELQKAREALKK